MALLDVSKDRATPVVGPEVVFWSTLLLHMAVWTALPSAINPNLPLDVIEELAWGREWQWGYAKHPPLSAWLMEMAAVLGGRTDTALYFLSAAAVAITFWAVWRLGRALMSPWKALVGVLILQAIPYHNVLAVEFNANVALFPFWALTPLVFWLALRDGRLGYWLLTGAFAALGMLTKYSLAVLLLPIAAWLLAVPSARRHLASPGPYLGLAVFLLILAPHGAWLVANDFPTLAYAMRRSGLDEGPSWSDHLVQPLAFLAGQAIYLVLPAALLWSLGRPAWRRLDDATRYLAFVTLAPFGLVALISALTGGEMRSMWAASMLPFAGLLMVSVWNLKPPEAAMRRVAVIWIALIALTASAFAVDTLAAPSLVGRAKRTQAPGEAMALRIAQDWQARTGEPLRIVIGDPWAAGNVAWYAPERPSVYLDADPAVAPWTSDQAVAEAGAVAVWLTPRGDTAPVPLDRSPLSSLAARFPAIEEQPPFPLAWPNAPALPPQIVNWAIIRPAPKMPQP